ncbi:glycosyltransferase family 2 protein [Paenibacillus rhizophilus]|uniref:Glycosyltransferase n=1 Tax=Paenibacillus rhizophilus TaxID=1850366 RepID=A0A3N9P5E5_9BACL|nr:glycosyltransferase [Paenibacillus rhizophilus]RQW10640.1 glycosyltransferase [Paenibacillus rhizophilus]
MSVKVSVIIPVYNAGSHLRECIESLMKQTLGECEFIFVNDGSTDDSRAIIEEHLPLDPRIRFINQENEGVSIARNAGLKAAGGQYIGFVDADDTVEPDMFEVLYNGAIQWGCDAVISDFASSAGSHRIVTSFPLPRNVKLDREYIRGQLLPEFIKSDVLNSVWNKLYKAEVVKGNRVAFPAKVSLGEDGTFNVLFFSGADSAVYIDYCGYHYKETAGSATRNIAEKDYFARAVQVYEARLPQIYTGLLDGKKIAELKSEKLINTVMSIIHLYFEPSREMGLRQRYKYIRDMIGSRTVREALPIYLENHFSNSDRYRRMLLGMIRRKVVPGLYLATAYSRMRNR